MPRRYALFGAGLGFAIGLIVAGLTWRQLAAGQRPAFMLEIMSFLAAPPFGLFLSYAIGAVTGLGRRGFIAWVVLTPTINWALVGLGIGAIRHIRATNRAHRLKSRPSA